MKGMELTREDGNKVTVFLWKDVPEWDGFTREASD